MYKRFLDAVYAPLLIGLVAWIATNLMSEMAKSAVFDGGVAFAVVAGAFLAGLSMWWNRPWLDWD